MSTPLNPFRHVWLSLQALRNHHSLSLAPVVFDWHWKLAQLLFGVMKIYYVLQACRLVFPARARTFAEEKERRLNFTSPRCPKLASQQHVLKLSVVSPNDKRSNCEHIFYLFHPSMFSKDFSFCFSILPLHALVCRASLVDVVVSNSIFHWKCFPLCAFVVSVASWANILAKEMKQQGAERTRLALQPHQWCDNKRRQTKRWGYWSTQKGHKRQRARRFLNHDCSAHMLGLL